MSGHDLPSYAEQLREKCVYFNGVMSKACKAGIHYDDLRGADEPKLELPCNLRFATYTKRPVADCALRRFPTDAEIEAEEKDSAEAVSQYFGKMASDICPHCDKPILRKKQVGRCVYAEPCGCRLYQGTVPR